MSIPIGSVSLAVNTPGVFQGAPSQGIQGIIIANNSPFDVNINMQGTAVTKTLLPSTADFFQTTRGFNGNISYSPTQVVTNPSSFTATTLGFEAVGLNETLNVAAYPIALPRSTETPTATGNPIFTATFSATGSISGGQHLEVFNPVGSGVKCILHSARAFTTDTNEPTLNLIYTATDHNFTTGVPCVCHSGFTNPPVSVCHATAQDLAGTFGATASQDVETLNMPSGTVVEMTVYPDNTTFNPGEGIIFELSGTAQSKTIRLTVKWTETIYTVPQGGVNLGTIVNQVINEGNKLQAVIQATKLGDAPEDALIMNDGSGHLNGTFTFGGSGTGLTVTNNELISGTLTVTGEVTANSDLKTNSIRDNTNGNLAEDLSAGDGSVKFPVAVKFPTIGSITAGYQMIADTSIAQAGTSVAHSLGVIPTVILWVHDAGAFNADVITINYGTATSSHFTAYSSNAAGTTNIRFFVMA